MKAIIPDYSWDAMGFLMFSCYFCVTESMNWSTGPVISWTSMFAPVHVIPAVGGLGRHFRRTIAAIFFQEKKTYPLANCHITIEKITIVSR